MKKLVFILMLAAISMSVFSQITPGATMRISAVTTVLGQNIPAGVTIFAIADSTLWVTKAAVATTHTVRTGYAAGLIMPITTGGGVLYSESFELTAPDASNKTVLLSHFPLDSTGITVSLNGYELKRTVDYWLSGATDSTITIRKPAYTYDRVTVSYNRIKR